VVGEWRHGKGADVARASAKTSSRCLLPARAAAPRVDRGHGGAFVSSPVLPPAAIPLGPDGVVVLPLPEHEQGVTLESPTGAAHQAVSVSW
jgi:hypothetical protein